MLRDFDFFALKEQVEGSQRQARFGASASGHSVKESARALKGARRNMVRHASDANISAPFQGADIFTTS